MSFATTVRLFIEEFHFLGSPHIPRPLYKPFLAFGPPPPKANLSAVGSTQRIVPEEENEVDFDRSPTISVEHAQQLSHEEMQLESRAVRCRPYELRQ
ncbi:hypothetical protein NP233_g1430 [Leucocoprinus birnbaumii]|uniref:Uncharacterized protein n=1 Tax=Leucocoprinus birnbaumii TaxID=56174 RepID=A0AAD5YZJ4_9AGAR|nr:hypothetical protein NP233_g1430 [Leucocoprinus birnbaumii]